jgi:hypothetical protein
MLTLILLVFAFVFFCIATWMPPDPAPARWSRLISAGLAAWVLAELVNRAPGAFAHPGLW